MVQDFSDPAIIASVETTSRFLNDGVSAPHELQITSCNLGRWKGKECCWIAIEKTEVFNVHGARVVMHGAVIISIVEFLTEALWQLNLFSDFFFDVTVISQTKCLIMNVLIHIALFLEVFDSLLAAPYRPMMTGEFNFESIAE